MSVTLSDVEKIAKLAKLDLSSQEKLKLADQMAEIVRYVEKLNELDTENIAPTSHVLDLKNVFREDKVQTWLTQDEALSNAPAKNQGFFSVPKVIGGTGSSTS